VADGEWILAIFEIGSRRRATAAAARGVRAAGDTHLEFERRDWDRLIGFVSARSEHMKVARAVPSSERRLVAAPPSTSEPPRSRVDEEPSPASLESSRVPFGSRVLVLDTDSKAGSEIRVTLTELGLVVELVTTIKAAEERLTAQSFDALVFELNVGGSDSRILVERLRKEKRITGIPVLFLSSKPTSRDVVDAFASGGDDFLPKPFRTPELAARLFSLLRRARVAGALFGGESR
jgi:two-component system phosphate regulon response regulator PhoB